MAYYKFKNLLLFIKEAVTTADLVALRVLSAIKLEEVLPEPGYPNLVNNGQ